MNIGFIGTGRMGAPMVVNLLKAGHTVAVTDVRREAAAAALAAGARWASGVAEAVAGAEVIFTSLPGPVEVEQVARGILASAPAGAVYVDLSTNAPSVVRRLSAEFAARGIAMLDGPVSGGEEGAIAGTLTVMVGGDEAAFHRVEPVLQAMGRTIYYCGGIGNGSVTKLANNLTSVGNAIVLAETLTMGVKAGVPLRVLADVLGRSSGSSERLTRKFPRYSFAGNFTPGFAVSLSAKDTRLALELAAEVGVPMQAGRLAQQELQALMDRGWADRDSDSLVVLQEERAGVQLRLL